MSETGVLFIISTGGETHGEDQTDNRAGDVGLDDGVVSTRQLDAVMEDGVVGRQEDGEVAACWDDVRPDIDRLVVQVKDGAEAGAETVELPPVATPDIGVGLHPLGQVFPGQDVRDRFRGIAADLNGFESGVLAAGDHGLGGGVVLEQGIRGVHGRAR